MSGNLVCRVSGGLTSYEKCTTYSYIYIKTSEEYVTGQIQVMVKGVVNPSLTGKTDGFAIETEYNQLPMDTTYTASTISRTVTTSAAPSPIFSQGIEFEPKNEGERAQYKFKFYTTNIIDPDTILVIQFPAEYDSLLGYEIQCKVLLGIQGQPSCEVKDHRVFMKGF